MASAFSDLRVFSEPLLTCNIHNDPKASNTLKDSTLISRMTGPMIMAGCRITLLMTVIMSMARYR